MSDKRGITCCFTGHRPDAFDFGYDEGDPRCRKLKSDLEQAIERAAGDGYRRFVTGMAQGVDMWCAEMVLDMKEDGQPFTLEAAVPARGQAARWNAPLKKRHERILRLCDNVICIGDSLDRETLLMRNRYMLSQSSLVIAVARKKSGGTAYTVNLASRLGITVWYV